MLFHMVENKKYYTNEYYRKFVREENKDFTLEFKTYVDARDWCIKSNSESRYKNNDITFNVIGEYKPPLTNCDHPKQPYVATLSKWCGIGIHKWTIWEDDCGFQKRRCTRCNLTENK